MEGKRKGWKRRSRKSAVNSERAKAMPHRSIRGKERVNATGTMTKPPWVAPDDMPQWVVDLIKAGKMCGANLRSPKPGGLKWCTLRPSPHQREIGRPLPHRCKWHGGNLPGSATQIATVKESMERRRRAPLIDGVYACAVLPGEEEVWQRLMTTSSLDPEIAILKLRLRRAVKAEADWLEAKDAGLTSETMEVAESETSSEVGEQGSMLRERRVMRDVDHSRRVSMIVSELAKILSQKAIMQGEDVSDVDRARLAREALAEARAGIGLKRQAKDGG